MRDYIMSFVGREEVLYFIPTKPQHPMTLDHIGASDIEDSWLDYHDRRARLAELRHVTTHFLCLRSHLFPIFCGSNRWISFIRNIHQDIATPEEWPDLWRTAIPNEGKSLYDIAEKFQRHNSNPITTVLGYKPYKSNPMLVLEILGEFGGDIACKSNWLACQENPQEKRVVRLYIKHPGDEAQLHRVKPTTDYQIKDYVQRAYCESLGRYHVVEWCAAIDSIANRYAYQEADMDHVAGYVGDTITFICNHFLACPSTWPFPPEKFVPRLARMLPRLACLLGSCFGVMIMTPIYNVPEYEFFDTECDPQKEPLVMALRDMSKKRRLE